MRHFTPLSLLSFASYITISDGLQISAFDSDELSNSTSTPQPISTPVTFLQKLTTPAAAPPTTDNATSSCEEGCSCNDPTIEVPMDQLNVTVSQHNLSKVPKPDFDVPVSSDDECCGGKARITYKDTVIAETTARRTIRRGWKVTDACGRKAKANQTIEIVLVVNEYSKPPSKIHLDQCSQAGNLTLTNAPRLIKGDDSGVKITYSDAIMRTWKIFDGSGELKTFVQKIYCGEESGSSCDCPRHRRRCKSDTNNDRSDRLDRNTDG